MTANLTTNKVLESSIEFLMAGFVTFAALAPVFAQFANWSIYPFYLSLLILLNIFLLIQNQKSFWDIAVNPANIAMLCFIAVLTYVADTAEGFDTIFGAVLLPYALGLMYALSKPREKKFEQYVLILSAFKALLVLFFLDGLLSEYPIRPQFEGRAIYLQFGWALDVVPFLIIYYLFTKQKTSAISMAKVSLVLFVLAFVIVSMASRTMIILSLAFTVIFSFLYLSEMKIKLFGILFYPLAVFVLLMMLPVKQEHLLNLFATLGDMTNLSPFADSSSGDKSTSIRIRGLLDTFSTKDGLSEKYPLDLSSKNFYWAGHFWIGQLKYYTGYLGVLIFLTLIFYFVRGIYRLSERVRHEKCFHSVTLIALSVSYLFHIFYVGGILNDPIFFVLLGLVANSQAQNFIWNCSPNKMLLGRQ